MRGGADVVFYAIALILPLSALIARRLPIAQAMKMALAWVAIFAAVTLLVAQHDRIMSLWRPIGDMVSAGDSIVAGRAVRIPRSADGHFYVDATIGDVDRHMLVDSGASTTALSTGTARAAGLDLDASPFPRMIETANGTVTARTATIDHLVVGTIEMRELSIVSSDAFGDTDVLGMNFLSRLKGWRVDGNTMTLKQ